MFLVAALVLAGVVGYLWYRSAQKYALNVPDVQKKCVFITGCDSGFGRAIAIRLDGKGVHVFAGCLTDEGAKVLTQKCSSRLKTVRLDVTAVDSVNEALNFVSSNIPEGCVFWGVLNNAGVIGMEGPTELFDKDDYRKLLEVNFLGMTEVNKTFLSLIKKSSGRIVNMASISGLAAIPGLAPYTASKHAVIGYSDILRMEKVVWGIHVSVVAPGGFRTNIVDVDRYQKLRQDLWNRLPEDVQQGYTKEQYDRATEGMVRWQLEDSAVDLTPVLDAYEHGLFGRHPKAHYYPDSQGKALYCLYLLPRKLYDHLMVKEFVVKKMMPKNRS